MWDQLPEIYQQRRRAYRRLFLDGDGKPKPDAALVLADLKRFCYAGRSTLKLTLTRSVDTHAVMMAEGQREVFNRIQSYLNLNDRQLTDLIEENQQ